MKSQFLKPSLILLAVSLLYSMVFQAFNPYLCVTMVVLVALYGYEQYLVLKSDQIKQASSEKNLNSLRNEMKLDLDRVREEIKEGVDIAKAEAHRITMTGVLGGPNGKPKQQTQIRF